MKENIMEFLEELYSKAPTPGGGGASALIGCVSVALCGMVSNLTTGKKKYAEYENTIQEILKESKNTMNHLYSLIEKDALCFEPLSKAYGIQKEDPNREAILEHALKEAASVPMEILETVYGIIPMLEELVIKGSTLASSDVGVAASACKSALEGSVMNIYINTSLMKEKEYANALEEKATNIVKDGTKRCQIVYDDVMKQLLGK